MKPTDTQYKKELIKSLKRDKWRQSVPQAEFEARDKVFTSAQETSLKIIKKQNKAFRRRKIETQTPAGLPKISGRIPETARAIYDKLKEDNSARKPCPELGLRGLLFLIHHLNAAQDNNSRPKNDLLSDCIRNQASNYETSWDSPSFILKALRGCILGRQWGQMTKFLLVLLNYDKKYLHVVKNMCRVMLKLNPVITQSGLEEQFRILTEEATSELAIV